MGLSVTHNLMFRREAFQVALYLTHEQMLRREAAVRAGITCPHVTQNLMLTRGRSTKSSGVKLRSVLARRRDSNTGQLRTARHLRISSIEEGGGAAKTGVLAEGDWLLGVDGAPVDGLSVQARPAL